ncbi:MAG TPA: hypothetical protein VLZ07_00395, partial [Syntrophales bacterium]|nr:hypothetical protein [Syntrophales bacterium]
MAAVGDNSGDAKNWISGFLRYVKAVCSTVLEAGILIVAAFAVYAFLLYFAKMIWNVYIATDVGRYYLTAFPVPAQRTAR